MITQETQSVILTQLQQGPQARFVFLRTSAAGVKAISTAKHLRKTIDFQMLGTVVLEGPGMPDGSLRDYVEASYGAFVEV